MFLHPSWWELEPQGSAGDGHSGVAQGEKQRAQQELSSDLQSVPTNYRMPLSLCPLGPDCPALLVDSGALLIGGKGPKKVPGHSKDWPTGLRRLALFC